MMVSTPLGGAVRGRPRDDAREQAILHAALELLTEVGYERMSMVAVAARARASKATIYRRWAGKDELVVEAIRRQAVDDIIIADTGSLRGDMIDIIRQKVRRLADGGAALMAGVVLAMRDSVALASALRAQMIEDGRGLAALIVQRAVDRGEPCSPTAACVFNELVPAAVFFRLLITGEALDDVFIHHLVDDILLPLMTVER
ncbi:MULTISPECIES: TetR/AcrR family transcriptional regulator [Protofrankia]|uniref:Regulatory protein TetR n=1 Tax=Candidatus Protofrankia datiscae TaxID=2716812 RepID=F8B554_9ACTN|nr:MULTISPECIES: TetR/AcrR family transcriptional regulator [Protofrankia]AEH11079.1 regulatory protein TetR [Candidatus Protofrankia datiscae]